MAGNTTGDLFRVTTFGESHGVALGVVVDGCPPQLVIDEAFIKKELARRKPGQSSITTNRNEAEEYEILSGVFEGKTTGAPIAIIVRNKDQRSGDYDALKDIIRPSHADYTYQEKYGIRDHRGSGRASARETISRVIAGAIAKLYLQQYNITIQAYVQQVGNIAIQKNYTELNIEEAENNIVRCPDLAVANKMIAAIDEARNNGDTLGGIISCVVKNVQAGIGEPVFDKLHADLGKAVLSINACKGIAFGSGFEGASKKGSEQNDAFVLDQANQIKTSTNRSGGIQGGISNGEDIYFTSAFKPVSSIGMKQQTVTTSLTETELEIKGRHDPCVLPRAVVIVEAMVAITIVDFVLRQQAVRMSFTDIKSLKGF